MADSAKMTIIAECGHAFVFEEEPKFGKWYDCGECGTTVEYDGAELNLIEDAYEVADDDDFEEEDDDEVEDFA